MSSLEIVLLTIYLTSVAGNLCVLFALIDRGYPPSHDVFVGATLATFIPIMNSIIIILCLLDF